MNKCIYLDYAATSPIDPRVAEKMQAYMTQNFGNPSSIHAFGRKAKDAVELARHQIAELIHANVSEIIFTSGATESNNFALKNVAEFYQHKGKHIVTLATEHRSVLACCEYLEKKGFSITYLTPEKNGILDSDKLKAALRSDTILVSIMHVNNELGVIQDIDSIAEITSSQGILLHVDAAQSPGKVPIDVRKTPIDLMSLCAHKVYGPKGIGAIYIRKNSQVKVMARIHGGGQEQGLRSGTLATHQIIGMGEAFDIANHEIQKDVQHIHFLRNYFLKGLEYLVSLNSDSLKCVPNILNVRLKNMYAKDLLAKIPQIAASTASACQGKNSETSHVLRAIGLDEEKAMQSIRFSFGRFTTQEEIEMTINKIHNLLAS
jgi:cysteine desulfurase